jgi:hypothetical protein
MFWVLAPCIIMGRCQGFGKKNILTPHSGLKSARSVDQVHIVTFCKFIIMGLSMHGS